MGSPLHPVRRGEITCKGLGMAVDVLDERGASVYHEKVICMYKTIPKHANHILG